MLGTDGVGVEIVIVLLPSLLWPQEDVLFWTEFKAAGYLLAQAMLLWTFSSRALWPIFEVRRSNLCTVLMPVIALFGECSHLMSADMFLVGHMVYGDIA